MQNTPDYLYHYTSIETLALILANHTFRLTSLDQMDDLQEKEAFDLKNAGQVLGLMMKQRISLCGKCIVL